MLAEWYSFYSAEILRIGFDSGRTDWCSVTTSLDKCLAEDLSLSRKHARKKILTRFSGIHQLADEKDFRMNI